MNVVSIRSAPEAVIDRDGTYRQIVFVTLSDENGLKEGTKVALRRADGKGEEAKSLLHDVGPGAEVRLGFWLPVGESEVGREIAVEVLAGLPSGERRVQGRFTVPSRTRFPLRLDLIAEGLRHKIEGSAWEGDCFAGARFRAVPEEYLAQHEVVYRRPVDHWQDGLLVGNGDFGGMITGAGEFSFWMQKTDLWATDRRGVGTGRCWGGVLMVDLGRPFDLDADRFEDRLSLYEGRVQRTWSGEGWEAQVSAYVQSDRNLARIRCRVRSETPVSPAITLERPAHVFRAARSSSSVESGAKGRDVWVEHVLPNMRYAISTRVIGADVQVEHETNAGGARCKVTLASSRSLDFEILVALVTDRECRDPLVKARELTDGGAAIDPEADRSTHRVWWNRHWGASFVDLSDKFVEHTYYCGMYQQACVSRGEQAISFMGLSYMGDNPPWSDGYTTDAQTPVMWWSIYPSNRLDLGYSYMRTFLEMIPEFIEHSPHQGMEVAHQAAALWAGGHRWLATIAPNPHKSSTAWFHLNFWQHYDLTGDVEFLRDYLYPLMASAARYGRSVMEEGEDGRFHILQSGSPEQSGASVDPAIDRAMYGSLLDHLIEAAETLGEEEETRRLWREMRDRLFDYPQDDESIHESRGLAHPYRCHPSVFSGVYPTGEVTPRHPLYRKFVRALEVTKDLVAFRGMARHEAFPAFEGGFEPVGFTAGWLPIVASRLDLSLLSRTLFYSPFLRFCLKPNGQIALADLRQGDWTVGRLSIVEGTNVLCAGVHEWLLQVRDGVVHLFPGALDGETMRFSNLRTAGAFLFAAERKGEGVAYFTLRSLRGGACRVRNPWGQRAVRIEDVEAGTTEERSGSELKFETREGALYAVTPAGTAWTEIEEIQLTGERMRGPRVTPALEIERYGAGQNFYPWLRGAGQIVRDGNLYIGMPDPSPDLPTDPMAAVTSETRRWQHMVDPESPVDREILTRNLENDDWKVRQDAVRRIGSAPSQDLATIQKKLDDPHPIVRRTAQACLARSGEQEGAQALMRVVLLSSDAGDRAEALRFLRQMDDGLVLKAIRDKRLIADVEKSGET